MKDSHRGTQKCVQKRHVRSPMQDTSTCQQKTHSDPHCGIQTCVPGCVRSPLQDTRKLIQLQIGQSRMCKGLHMYLYTCTILCSTLNTVNAQWRITGGPWLCVIAINASPWVQSVTTYVASENTQLQPLQTQSVPQARATPFTCGRARGHSLSATLDLARSCGWACHGHPKCTTTMRESVLGPV